MSASIKVTGITVAQFSKDKTWSNAFQETIAAQSGVAKSAVTITGVQAARRAGALEVLFDIKTTSPTAAKAAQGKITTALKSPEAFVKALVAKNPSSGAKLTVELGKVKVKSNDIGTRTAKPVSGWVTKTNPPKATVPKAMGAPNLNAAAAAVAILFIVVLVGGAFFMCFGCQRSAPPPAD